MRIRYVSHIVISMLYAISNGVFAETPSTSLYKCSVERPADNSAIELSGLYTAGFERSMFVSENGNCTVWLAGDLSVLYSKVGGQTKGGELKAYITVAGKLSPSGMYGHFGVWEKEFEVIKVLRAFVIPSASK